MSHTDRPFSDSRSAPRATPVARRPDAPAGGLDKPPGTRVQPPLQEVLKGLDARELEGETVFDQLFGPWPEGDPRMSPR
jgi:hypothetical protein